MRSPTARPAAGRRCLRRSHAASSRGGQRSLGGGRRKRLAPISGLREPRSSPGVVAEHRVGGARGRHRIRGAVDREHPLRVETRDSRRSPARTRTSSPGPSSCRGRCRSAHPTSSRRTIAAARSSVQVGWPTWSATTLTVSRSPASRSMVRAKFGPWAAVEPGGAHQVAGSGCASSTRRSPSALVRPYAPCRIARRVLGVGRGRRAVEHVVGRELHEPGAGLRRGGASSAGTGRVDRQRLRLVRLGVVDAACRRRR